MSTNKETNKTTSTKSTSKKKKSTRNIVIIVIEVLIVVGLIGLCLYLFTDGFAGCKGVNLTQENVNPITEKVVEDDGTPVGSSDEVQQIYEDETNTNPMKDYTVIAFFGCDSREAKLPSRTRSDSIILVCIHNDTHEVKLCSVYRDTILAVHDDRYGTYNKVNIAYARGGYERAVSTLNSSLDLYIENYVTIGFKGLIDAVDALGGVYVDVDKSEIDHLNNYAVCMADELKLTYTPVKATGYQLLNGLQATAYCRIRYTKGNDFKRTERQREVLEGLLGSLQNASFSELTTIVNNLISEVNTSLTLEEILAYGKDISSYKIVDQNGFPQEDMRSIPTVSGWGSCVLPLNLESNVKWLHEFLFGDTEYEVSETVKTYSKEIQERYDSKTGKTPSTTEPDEGEEYTEE